MNSTIAAPRWICKACRERRGAMIEPVESGA